ncbi:quinone oxidoreductase family protein [Chitinophaga ginsengisoli]|uniref:NADPH2:quinone reductase n=1 Tax=Chitinophaga ginsengisoli TaxID=363837 RepID=A0A2P8FXI8_9BACT|nr:quinone oxidoreductase [Chitinophaga ginsengisoli]PSL26432.1 NADPH2:quinone reductase [Chitinophaga ginsengisoli]
MSILTKSGVVLIEQPGGPEVLKYETIDLAGPRSNEVLIEQKAIAVNFLDVFFRSGRFPLPAYPAPIGLEAAGIVTAIGEGVTSFAVGDRVAYYATTGAYAQKRVISVDDIFRLPDNITFDVAAAVMVKGLTAKMLIRDGYAVKAGQYVLIPAMMGGVGTLLSAWAKSLGAIVIGTVGSPAKKQLAEQRGYEHVIDLQNEDLIACVNVITGGAGVDVIYDSVGKDIFDRSMDLIKTGGTFVSYGGASGWPEVDALPLDQKNIHFVQAQLNNYPGYQHKKGEAMKEVFEQVEKGIFDVQHLLVYSLADAALAHADMESRKTTGSIILKP